MKNIFKIVIAGLLVALVAVGIAGATQALAQSAETMPWHGRGPGGGGHGFGLGQVELEAAAKVLNMTADELGTALQGGSTLQELADQAGVELADVQAAIKAAHATEMRDRIAQAVEDGTITQENADWLLEGLDKGFVGVPGAGFGMGHGGYGEPGGWFGANSQTAP